MPEPSTILKERLLAAHRRKRSRERLAVLALLAAGILLGFFGIFLLDYLVRFPTWVRMLLGAALLALFGGVLPRFFRGRLWGGAKDIVGIAREVEGRAAGAGGSRGFLSVVVSAVEFAGDPDAPGSPQLKDCVVRNAQSDDFDPRKLVLHDVRLVRTGWRLLAGAAAVYTLWTLIGPDSLATFWMRMLGMRTHYQTRTHLESVEAPKAVPQFRDILVRVKASGVLPAQGKLRVAYAGEASFSIPLQPVTGTPGRFEAVVKEASKNVELTVRLGDAASEPIQVEVIKPPYVKDGKLEAAPPAYTRLAAVPYDLGDVEVPEGSQITIRVTPDRPVKECWLEWNGENIRMEPVGERWQARGLTALKPVRYSIRLLDARGVENADRIAHQLLILPDLPPVVTLGRPVSGSSYPPISAVRWMAKASDDYGMERIQLHYAVCRENETGQRLVLREGDAVTEPGNQVKETTLSGTLKLADLKLEAGQTLVLQARAFDRQPERVKKNEAGVSAEVILRIVTPEEYRNLIDEEMVGLGKTVDDLTTGMKKQQATLRGESGSK